MQFREQFYLEGCKFVEMQVLHASPPYQKSKEFEEVVNIQK
jgi:hypothetical protein